MAQQFIVTHSSTKRTYKSGFSSFEAASEWMKTNKKTLVKYLPTECTEGDFFVKKEG